MPHVYKEWTIGLALLCSVSADTSLRKSAAAACSQSYSEDCRATGRCCSPEMVCYEKDEGFGACLPSCSPGVHHGDAIWAWSPWSCRVLEPVLEVHYDRIPNQALLVGSVIKSRKNHVVVDSLGSPWKISAQACVEMCDEDERCDAVEFVDQSVGTTSHCNLRQLPRSLNPERRVKMDGIKESEYTYVFMKLEQAHPSFHWRALRGKVVTEDALRIRQVLYGDRANGGDFSSDVVHTMPFSRCQRLCAMSRLCGCFDHNNVTGECRRFLDCHGVDVVVTPAGMELDARHHLDQNAPQVLHFVVPEYPSHKVFVKGDPVVPDEVGFWDDWWTWGLWPSFLLALLLACCCWLCFLLLLLVNRRKELRSVQAMPDLNIVLEDVSNIQSWPGSCGKCGCACGRPPFWIPNEAVVVLDAEEGLSPRLSSLKTHPARAMEDVLCSEPLQPGDVLVALGHRPIRELRGLEKELKSATPGLRLQLLVLRPRRAGRYHCSPDREEAEVQPLAPRELDFDKALGTHQKVVIELVVQE